jgi:hypothetical protein
MRLRALRFANRAIDHARLLYAFATLPGTTFQTYCQALEGSITSRPFLCQGQDIVGASAGSHPPLSLPCACS